MTVPEAAGAQLDVFLVPLGDIVPKKRLILTKLFLVCAALVATGLAANVQAMAAGVAGSASS